MEDRLVKNLNYWVNLPYDELEVNYHVAVVMVEGGEFYISVHDISSFRIYYEMSKNDSGQYYKLLTYSPPLNHDGVRDFLKSYPEYIDKFAIGRHIAELWD